eukprot:TRINITY_DN459_c1_g1_i7.p1 TRINITY_DN459_c1_g1~~TRINITY_DN459_c1_g1_i7.p1  ORF type:complete len:455 (-),score=82.89 TRINITY_DN459_c1_g1_i7:208-1572(-)
MKSTCLILISIGIIVLVSSQSNSSNNPGLSVYFGLDGFKIGQGLIYAVVAKLLPNGIPIPNVTIPPFSSFTKPSHISNITITDWRFNIDFVPLGLDNKTLNFNIHNFKANISANIDLAGVGSFNGWMTLNQTQISLIVGSQTVNGSILPHLKNASISLASNSLDFSVWVPEFAIDEIRTAIQTDLPGILVSSLNSIAMNLASIKLGGGLTIDASFSEEPYIFNFNNNWNLHLPFKGQFKELNQIKCNTLNDHFQFEDKSKILLSVVPSEGMLNCLIDSLKREQFSLSSANPLFKLAITQWTGKIKLNKEKNSTVRFTPDSIDLSLNLNIDLYNGTDNLLPLPIIELSSYVNVKTNLSISGNSKQLVMSADVSKASVDPNSFYAKYNGPSDKWRENVQASNFLSLGTKLDGFIEPLLLGHHEKDLSVAPIAFFYFKTVQNVGTYYLGVVVGPPVG